MKKLSIIALLSIISMPGFATTVPADASESDVVTEQKLKEIKNNFNTVKK